MTEAGRDMGRLDDQFHAPNGLAQTERSGQNGEIKITVQQDRLGSSLSVQGEPTTDEEVTHPAPLPIIEHRTEETTRLSQPTKPTTAPKTLDSKKVEEKLKEQRRQVNPRIQKKPLAGGNTGGFWRSVTMVITAAGTAFLGIRAAINEAKRAIVIGNPDNPVVVQNAKDTIIENSSLTEDQKKQGTEWMDVLGTRNQDLNQDVMSYITDYEKLFVVDTETGRTRLDSLEFRGFVNTTFDDLSDPIDNLTRQNVVRLKIFFEDCAQHGISITPDTEPASLFMDGNEANTRIVLNLYQVYYKYYSQLNKDNKFQNTNPSDEQLKDTLELTQKIYDYLLSSQKPTLNQSYTDAHFGQSSRPWSKGYQITRSSDGSRLRTREIPPKAQLDPNKEYYVTEDHDGQLLYVEIPEERQTITPDRYDPSLIPNSPTPQTIQEADTRPRIIEQRIHGQRLPHYQEEKIYKTRKYRPPSSTRT